MTPRNPQTRILVLGGGLSGLMAAWQLGRRGVFVEVWEASGIPGGWAQTLVWPGPAGEPGALERGPQGLRFSPGSALDRLLRELEVPLNPMGPKGHRWWGRDGQRRPSPASLKGLGQAPGLSLRDKLRVGLEPFVPAGTNPYETLHAFFARRLGEGFARECLPALVGGVLAAPPDQLGLAGLPRLNQLEAHGGLIRGALRLGIERTRLPVGGAGALAAALVSRLGEVRVNCPAQALEARPQGRWRVHGAGIHNEVEAVVLALPPAAAAQLLLPLVPTAAELLASMPQLDLQVWHSRHAMVPGWERGFSLLLHPPEGRGLLGVVAMAADDPRGVPGLLQLRTYGGGAYDLAPELRDWPGVLGALRRWLPELSDAIQVREEHCPAAFPLLEPDHANRAARLIEALPPTLHWLGAARFGPGIPDLAEGAERWAATTPI